MRAGLVKGAEEWQWSSVHDYTGCLSATFRPRIALWPAIVYCWGPTNGDEFEGKAAEHLKREILMRYPCLARRKAQPPAPPRRWVSGSEIRRPPKRAKNRGLSRESLIHN